MGTEMGRWLMVIGLMSAGTVGQAKASDLRPEHIAPANAFSIPYRFVPALLKILDFRENEGPRRTDEEIKKVFPGEPPPFQGWRGFEANA